MAKRLIKIHMFKDHLQVRRSRVPSVFEPSWSFSWYVSIVSFNTNHRRFQLRLKENEKQIKTTYSTCSQIQLSKSLSRGFKEFKKIKWYTLIECLAHHLSSLTNHFSRLSMFWWNETKDYKMYKRKCRRSYWTTTNI